MNKPCYLTTGDKIRIISPAGNVSVEKTEQGIELLRNEGFEVQHGNHVFERFFQFAGTDEQRLDDLQEALDDESCKAIICSRGGYGTIRLISRLDFSKFCKNPKWLVGFSDITILHSILQGLGFCSVHGAMPGFYSKEGAITQSYIELIKILTGKNSYITVPKNGKNREGTAIGKVVGGNLSILYSLLGTPLELDTSHKILFIEEINEYLYHIDRMMWSLKLAGKLEKLAGLVVGGFSDTKDNDSPFGQAVEDIVMNVVKEYRYPVCFDFPAGHIDVNLPLVLGANYSLEVGENVKFSKLS